MYVLGTRVRTYEKYTVDIRMFGLHISTILLIALVIVEIGNLRAGAVIQERLAGIFLFGWLDCFLVREGMS